MSKSDREHQDNGPEDSVAMADEYPSPEATTAHLADPMDMSSELANQAAAQARQEANSSLPTRDATDQVDMSTAQHEAVDHNTTINDSFFSQGGLVDEAQQRSSDPHLNSAGPSSARYPHASTSSIHLPRRRETPSSEPPSAAEQIRILRESYARNPNPGKRELESLAERTGRPFNKVREYFRQRRNKLRGLGDLESMEEPGRASGWLQITYRSAPHTSQVSQLSLYNSYKSRFDPYNIISPLLGGQELIELVCATFPGTAMAKTGNEYVMSGLKEKEGGNEEWEKGLDGVVEPVRASAWLLGTYQQSKDAPPLPQTELYTSYALRFSSPFLDTNQQQNQAQSQPQQQLGDTATLAHPVTDTADHLENDTNGHGHGHDNDEFDISHLDEQHAPPPPRENRLLNPVDLINLARMTFPQCQPAVDEDGKFVMKGLERREAVEKGWNDRSGDMFPFALVNEPNPSDPAHPFTSLLKRKLAALHPDASPSLDPTKKPRTDGLAMDTITPTHNGAERNDAELGPEEKELLEGLKRFKGSAMGKEVRDICVNQ